MTYAELPVSSLVNANPTWARQDFGPIDALAADIRQHGLQEPILVAPDYLVLDGARRLAAATMNKMVYVPVVICRTWEALIERFRPTASSAYPLTWLEIAVVIEHILRPVYQEFRYRMSNMTRDARRLEGEMGGQGDVREHGYSYFTMAVAQAFNAQPVHIKMLRDNVRRLQNLQDSDPQLVAVMSKAIQEIEPAHRRDLALVRVLKTTLDRYLRGRESAPAAADLLRDQVAAMGNQSGVLRYTRRKKNTIDASAPVVGLGVIRNFAEVLSNLTQQAETFRNFNPVTKHQIEQFTIAYQTVVNANAQLYRLRRRMESALHNSTPGEEKDPENA